MPAPESHIVESNGKTVGENAADALGAQTAADASVVGGTYTATEQGVLVNLQTRMAEVEAKLAALGVTV